MLALLARSASAQSASPAEAADFPARMQAVVGFVWAENPLRSGLYRLSATQDVAIWLDRRVDPDQHVDFAVRDLPLEEALRRLAGELQLGVCQVGPVVYLGPPETAAKLATVSALREQEAAALPAAARASLGRRRSSTWKDLATPQGLLQQLSRDSNVRIVGLETLPHDLWPGNRLPGCTFVERLTLIAAGFDLTFEFSPDGKAVRFQRLPETAVLERTYDLNGPSDPRVKDLQRRFPAAHLRVSGSKLLVAAGAQDQDAIGRLLRGEAAERPPVKPAAGGIKVYSVKFENQPAGVVASTVAKQLGLTLKASPEVRERLQMLVSVDVKEVSLDELLKKALAPTGLSYRRDAEVLEILPGE
ncbi:STN domain-containing protein [Lignipirellula cremea]|nr:STN domain-containing protein [Lignipirellula cremea]